MRTSTHVWSKKHFSVHTTLFNDHSSSSEDYHIHCLSHCIIVLTCIIKLTFSIMRLDNDIQLNKSDYLRSIIRKTLITDTDALGLQIDNRHCVVELSYN